LTEDILRPETAVLPATPHPVADSPGPVDILGTSPNLLSDEDRLHRQKREMKNWQDRARKKFAAFKREQKRLGKHLSADELRNLFASAFPSEAIRCAQHLCRRCGLPVGIGEKGFVCEACKSQANEVTQ
jgi:hypothetical protein